MDCRQVEANVRATFSDECIPAPNEIAPHNCPECGALADSLGDRKWTSLTLAEVQENQDQLPLLSIAAFRYFLPAWMLAALKDETVRMFVLFALSPSPEDNKDKQDWMASRFSVFGSEALEAILSWLGLVRAMDAELGDTRDADKAIRFVEALLRGRQKNNDEKQ